MRSNSLRFRLVVSSTIVSVVLLAAAGVLLAGLFEAAVERNFDQGLRSDLDALLSKVDLAENGILSLTSDLSNAQYGLPLSGWYWQISPVKGNPAEGLSSTSLVKLRIDPAAETLSQRDADNVARFNMTDENGKHIRVLEQRVQLFGESEFSFLVAGNFDELSGEISTFRRILFSVLGLLGAGLIGAIVFQVSFGLRPLRELQERLSAIREGKAEKMEGDYPIEIQPVADELNLLIQSNAEVVDRARTQVGNLAHALKTPLSVLANEARLNKGALAHKVDEQTQVMRDQVSLYLDRARRAARAQTLGSVTEVEVVLRALARTLMRIHRDKGLAIEVKCPPGAKFRGERQDLEEMAGNLLDNACKWARQRILAECVMLRPEADGRLWLEVQVNDDGPGLPPEKWEEAMKRGRRLDETKSGSGLGLSIVTETAGMYAGTLRLGAAPAGGLLTVLKLPAVA
jgi:signal transduction histidine kinase